MTVTFLFENQLGIMGIKSTHMRNIISVKKCRERQKQLYYVVHSIPSSTPAAYANEFFDISSAPTADSFLC